MSNHYRGPSIDASFQVSVHLAKWFQKRLKCEKLTDDRRRTQGDGEQAWPPQAFLASDWSISKNLLLRNRLAK
jgi:hypothetical protein